MDVFRSMWPVARARHIEMPAEVGAAHPRLAAVESPQRIGEGIFPRVVVCELNEALEGPEKIAHRLVERQAPVGAGGTLHRSSYHHPVLVVSEACLD